MKPKATKTQSAKPSPTAVQAFKTTATHYRMEHIPWSAGRDYRILNGQGELVCFVDGKLFAPPRRLTLRNEQGKEVAQLREQVLAIHGTFEVWRGGTLAATTRQSLIKLVRSKHTVTLPDQSDRLVSHFWNELGKFLCATGELRAGYARVQASVEKYDLYVLPSLDQELYLAILVAVIQGPSEE